MYGLFVVLALCLSTFWCCTASAANPTIVISGLEWTDVIGCHYPRSSDNLVCTYAWDAGTVTVTAHGQSVQTTWGQPSTAHTIAQALCSQMTSTFAVQCTGTTDLDSRDTQLNLTDSNYYWITTSVTDTVYNSWTRSYNSPYFSAYPSNLGDMGHLNPKYIVIGVTYAPPGHSSTVTYGSSTMVGTTNTNSSSFKQGYSLSVSIKGCAGDVTTSTGIPGFSGGVCVTGTTDSSHSQQSVNSNSITIQNTVSIQNKTTGTPGDFNPVNHDYDLVWLWLNPLVRFSVWSDVNNVEWNGYGFDMTDQPAMDIWPVLLGYLNGDFKRSDGTPCYATDSSCDAEDANVLARSWVTQSCTAGVNCQVWPTGEQPGLTLNDLAQIAKADPWGNNPAYAIQLGTASPPTTTDGRFTIVPVSNGNSQSFEYKQAGPGNGSGLSQTYTNQNTVTNTVSNGNNYEIQQAFSIEVQSQGTFFWQTVGYDFKQTSTFTWDHSHMTTNANTNTSTDTLTIVGPPCPAAPPGPCNPQYTGFPQFDVYQDNIFGSFAFWGVN